MPTAGASRPHLADEPAGDVPSPGFEPPPGNVRFPLFDGLRGLAVLGVLLFHDALLTGRVGLGPLGRMAEVPGTDAVLLFFVISGFLLYRPYVLARARGGRAPTLRRYARRRAMRILPAYWITLTLLAIFPGIIGVFSGDWWRYYGYLQIYSHRTYGAGIAQAWTLCVEMSFYVLLPLWAAVIRRSGPARRPTRLLTSELGPLAALAVSGIVVQVAGARRDVTSLLSNSIAGQCTWLAVGMALATVSVVVQQDSRALPRLRAIAARPGLCWLASAAAYGGLMLLVPAGGVYGIITEANQVQPLVRTVLRLALEAIQVSTLVLPAVFGDPAAGLPRRLLSARALVALGVVSYSFYLWHFTIAELIAEPHIRTSFYAAGLGLVTHVHVAVTVVLYLVTLAATWLVAAVSYRWVELPFLVRKER